MSHLDGRLFAVEVDVEKKAVARIDRGYLRRYFPWLKVLRPR